MHHRKGACRASKPDPRQPKLDQPALSKKISHDNVKAGSICTALDQVANANTWRKQMQCLCLSISALSYRDS
jgi:hypothetical protein